MATQHRSGMCPLPVRKAHISSDVSQNPGEWSAHLLLGLEALNASKNESQTDEERREEFLTGTRLIERAFNANQRNSAAANALCELFLQKGQTKRVRWASITLRRMLLIRWIIGSEACRAHDTVR